MAIRKIFHNDVLEFVLRINVIIGFEVSGHLPIIEQTPGGSGKNSSLFVLEPTADSWMRPYHFSVYGIHSVIELIVNALFALHAGTIVLDQFA